MADHEQAPAGQSRPRPRFPNISPSQQVTAMIAAPGMIAVHTVLLATTGNRWCLLAYVALPPAGWFLFRGARRHQAGPLTLGLLLFVIGAMLPFYLT